MLGKKGSGVPEKDKTFGNEKKGKSDKSILLLYFFIFIRLNGLRVEIDRY